MSSSTNYTHWFIRARLKTRQLLLLVAMALFVLNAISKALKANRPTAHEEPYVALSSVAQS